MRFSSLVSSLVPAAMFVAVATSPAFAMPSMIRLGYTNCAVCHISPQGGGLLTPYGHGVDLAQSLFSREYKPPEPSRVVYDARFVAVGLKTNDLSGPAQPSMASTYELMLRSSVEVSEHNRLSYTLEL